MTTEKAAGLKSFALGLAERVVKSKAGRSAIATGRQLHGAAMVPAATRSKRILKHGLVGAAVGTGGSVLRDKAQGRDVSVGRAMAAGFGGAALGGLSGTTAGRRLSRRALSSRKTPDLSLRESARSLVQPKGIRSAVKNMAPLEKAFLGVTAYDTAKQLSNPDTKGQRGKVIGSALGDAGALLTMSRWKGMRRIVGGPKGTYGARAGGSLGAAARGIGFYGAATSAGGYLGSRFDKKTRVTKEAPYG